ncbi:UNVERIFIED_ORG: broad specificity phosphatase PhoE [Arthrobacter sp. UYCu721]
MSESDGMDDVLDGGLRQSLMIASRIAETLARRRQESQRQQEHQDAQAAHEAQTRLAAERSAAHAALAPVEKDQWWDKAQPSDIATAHAVAEGWKDHDPAALAASDKIRQEVLTRYGIDTHDVGPDAAYLESGIQAITTEKARQDELARSQEETRKAAVEHEKAMQLLAAARAEELRAQAAKLAPELERHQVPAEYLANSELAQALQTAHAAKTPKALEAADATVQERMFLIGKDGINGPDIDQLRKETTANFNGAGDSHFEDPEFVKAAKEMHEAKLLAEGGFKGSERTSVEQRYERAEKELFARMEGLGREIENRVTGNDSSRLKDQGLKAESTSTADYGSAEHHEKFAESLANTGANENQIRGRLAAARSEGTHPSAAVTMGKGAAKAKKSRPGAAVGSERGKNGLTR